MILCFSFAAPEGLRCKKLLCLYKSVKLKKKKYIYNIYYYAFVCETKMLAFLYKTNNSKASFRQRGLVDSTKKKKKICLGTARTPSQATYSSLGEFKCHPLTLILLDTFQMISLFHLKKFKYLSFCIGYP